MDGSLSDEIIKNCVTTFFGIMQVIILGGLGTFVKVYLDTRSNKKSINAIFPKVRALEKKVFGFESSDQDRKEFP